MSFCEGKRNKETKQRKLTFPQKCENGFNHPVILTQTATAREECVVGIECKHFDATRSSVRLRRAT
jgi:hypothetical protein